ncbi:MAG: TonB-dependent receptor [Bacteroidetes bacterium]|nr:MAG: TonB-dependent receptor [Bacteroidota bacterium]
MNHRGYIVACFPFWLFALGPFIQVRAAGLLHNGTLKGMVMDARTGTGLVSALVVLEPGGQAAYTDELGMFAFQDLMAGRYTLVVSYLGFETARVEVRVRDHETTAVKIPLAPGGIRLEEIEIRAFGGSRMDKISALDIRTRPLNSSQDILRVVPGLFTAQHAGGGKAEQLFFRGFDMDHGTDLRIAVDGLPVNMVSHAHGQGYADLHWLIPELVSEVAFAKGPYDARAGNFATAGSVNFHTPVALDRNVIKLEAGQFDTWRALVALDLTGARDKVNAPKAWVASEFSFTNGFFEHPQNFTRFNLMGRYTTFTSEDQSLSVFFSTFRSRWDASGQIPQRAVERGIISRFGAIDATEGGETGRTNISLTFSKNIDATTFLKNRLYLVRYDFELFSNFTFFLVDSINGDQIRQRENRTLLGYEGSWHKEYRLGGLPLESEAGLQLRYDDVRGLELSHTVHRRQTLWTNALGNVSEANAGFYLDQQVRFSPHLSLDAGLRYDHLYFSYEDLLAPAFTRQTVASGVFSPKLSLFYDAGPHLRLFARVGTGFHSNDTRVVTAREGEEVLPRARGEEAGLLWKAFPSVLVGLTAWRLDLEQEFVYVGDEAVVEPSGRTRRQGLECSLRWQMAPWLFADADINYTLASARDAAEGANYIPLAPGFTSSGGLTAKQSEGFFGSLRYRYMADRPANEDYSITAEGYFIVDALVGWRNARIEGALQVQNLLDTPYNEAQFETTSRLKNEPAPVTELHFTPGSPFFLKGSLAFFF